MLIKEVKTALRLERSVACKVAAVSAECTNAFSVAMLARAPLPLLSMPMSNVNPCSLNPLSTKASDLALLSICLQLCHPRDDDAAVAVCSIAMLRRLLLSSILVCGSIDEPRQHFRRHVR